MLTEYLVEATVAEFRRELARHRLAEEARRGRGPGRIRRLVTYTFEPYRSRASNEALTEAHSAARMEKYAESRRVPSAPGE